MAKPTSSIAPPVPVSRDFATGSSTLIQTSGISSSDHLQNQPIAGAGSVDSSVNPRTSRVIRCTSRSPVKKGSTRAEVGGARRQPLAMSPEIRRTILQDSNPGNVGFLSEPRAAPNKSMPVTSTLEVHRQDRSEKSCCCLPGDVQSKPLSLISAESTAEDVHSDTSSAIISNAQRAITTHVQGSAGYYGGCLERPPIPGPAPDRALPSLPEDHGSNAPATPRRCGSSQQPARTDRSPARIVPPLRSPWKAKYNLYPAIDSSPTKRPASPVRLNTATEGEQLVSLLSSPSSLKRHAIAFGSADQLPASMSVGALDQLKRLEDTKAMKRRDLARMGSRKGAVTKTETSTAKSRRESGFHEGIIDLPTWPLQDTDDSACFSARHNRAQASQVSNLSASTTLQQRESRKYSPQELSPIIVIAEQKPVSPITGQPSNSSDLNRNSGRRIDEGPRIRKTNGFNHISPQPVSLQEQDIEGRLRPLSAHSIPAPRPVASRVPTPYSSPLLREPSQRSSHTPDSSMLLPETSDLEARLSAMEKKNVMLETAFWAVINTPVVCGGGCGLGGLECRREGDDGNRSSGLSSKEEERSSGASETGSLYAGLENLLALHSAAAGGERWCSIIGP